MNKQAIDQIVIAYYQTLVECEQLRAELAKTKEPVEAAKTAKNKAK